MPRAILELREGRVLRAEADVARERELDPDGEDPPLERDHHGLGALAPADAQGVDAGRGPQRAAGLDAGHHAREVETGREVLAGAEEHGAPKLVVRVVARVRVRERVEHLLVERVELLRPVQADEQDVAADLGRDDRRVGHG